MRSSMSAMMGPPSAGPVSADAILLVSSQLASATMSAHTDAFTLGIGSPTPARGRGMSAARSVASVLRHASLPELQTGAARTHRCARR